MTSTSVDILIIGGGIAGLWTLNRLCNRGYNAILLEQQSLGSHQTIASQGMIHGGMKYTLAGALTKASEAIAEMPEHWRDCLRGRGDVDLREARVLSDHFYLWSTANLASKFSGFLASKITRGRIEKLHRSELPELFAHQDFDGTLYRLVDMVVDTPSILRKLAANYRERIFSIDWSRARWQTDRENRVSLQLDHIPNAALIEPSAIVFTAGAGNAALLEAVDAAGPKMQRRPLQQVMVRHRHPQAFYGHCVAADSTPRLTLSSHPLEDGSQVWYLGGSLSEWGAGQTPSNVIAAAKKELQALVPWVDLGEAEWGTVSVDRAEPRQQNLGRPDQAFAQWAEGPANVVAAWPTKLTLSPNLAEQVNTLLLERGIHPQGGGIPDLRLPRPQVALAPWVEAFGVADAP